MIAADFMTKNVATVQPETTLADAVRIMLARNVSGLPVVDPSGQLVGIVTEGDLLRRSELGSDGERAGWLKSFLMPGRLAKEYVVTHGRRVSEVMTPEPLSVTPETDLAEIAGIMHDHRLRRLPVVEHGRLVGVIARKDLLRALALKLVEQPEAALGDAAIEQQIRAALLHERWAPHAGIRVRVKDHVVNLEGSVFSEAERRAVNVIAENTPGVERVHDEMVYVDPTSGLVFSGPPM